MKAGSLSLSLSLSLLLTLQECDGSHLNNLQGNGNLDDSNEIEKENKSDVEICKESNLDKMFLVCDVTAMVAYYLLIFYTFYLVCS